MAHKIAVNLICGALGCGKTSFIRQLLLQKPRNEKWALLINEFGAVGIDAGLFAEQGRLLVKSLSGGCICCSSKADFEIALNALIPYQPDRLIIEPTGLGEPDSLADLIQRGQLAEHFQLQQIVSLFDAANTDLTDLKNLRIYQTLVHMADQAIISKTDRATLAQTSALFDALTHSYPPIKVIHQLNLNQPLALFELSAPHQSPGLVFYPQRTPVCDAPAYQPNWYQAWCIDIKRQVHQGLDHIAIGWVFDASIDFNWQKLEQRLNQLSTHQAWSGVKRAKGVFRTGHSWMLFQWVHQQLTREIIAYRKDSRLEIIIEQDSLFELAEFEQALEQCLTDI